MTTAIAVFPVLLFIFNNIISPVVALLLNLPPIPLVMSVLIAVLFSLGTSFLTSKYQKRFVEIVKISGSLDIIVRDKNENIKDSRHIK